jgi:hypothetical protein
VAKPVAKPATAAAKPVPTRTALQQWRSRIMLGRR